MEGVTTKIYRGKVKSVEILENGEALVHFRDDITAGDGVKRDRLQGKGTVNCKTSSFIFRKLEKAGIPTHFIREVNENTFLARALEILPVEVVVRNIAAGSFCRRYGYEQGFMFNTPVVEFFYKDDELHDPLISKDVILKLGLATELELQWMESAALRVNSVLTSLFKEAGLILVDFKIEVGKDKQGRLYVADEISGDSIRVWDAETHEILDKDRFRKGLGEVVKNYEEIWRRISTVENDPKPEPFHLQIEVIPKATVPNPSGDVVKRGIVNLGSKTVEKVVVGKTILLSYPSEILAGDWRKELSEICLSFLSNPLIEDYKIQVVPK
ncbi:MAG: phosphoribosylaminoimidazolesuccinocarboxamide synthase [Methanobacteriota archaeon]|nr:MAG: phosphoribosylaminoimidazolesuccinocarboxamide synthase [Euryarchaeota archaeon]